MVRKKNNKVRIEFRKKHQSQTRDFGFDKRVPGRAGDIDTVSQERVSGKGDLTRHRTVKGNRNEDGESLGHVELDIDRSSWRV